MFAGFGAPDQLVEAFVVFLAAVELEIDFRRVAELQATGKLMPEKRLGGGKAFPCLILPRNVWAKVLESLGNDLEEDLQFADCLDTTRGMRLVS